MIKIVLPGKPIAWERPVIAPKSRWSKKTQLPHLFDSQQEQKKRVQIMMAHQLNEQEENATEIYHIAPHEAYVVRITCYLPVHTNISQTKENMIRWGLLLMSTVPDADNLAKFYLDCANGIVWPDDAYIHKLYVEKKFDNEDRRVEMEVWKDEAVMAGFPVARKVLGFLGPQDITLMMEQLGSMEIESISDTQYLSEDRLIDLATRIFAFAQEWDSTLKEISKCTSLVEEISTQATNTHI